MPWRLPGGAAWRRRVSSSSKRRGDLVQTIFRANHQRATQHYLADYHSYNNSGISTTASGTTTTMSCSYTYIASTTAVPLPDACATGGGEGVTDDEEKARVREHIKDLIHESHGAATGHALARWLSELQVSWVLHLAQLDASAGRAFVSRLLQYTARSWILALHAINSSIVSFNGWCSQDHEEDEAAGVLWPPASELVGFVAATFLQMLPFVDVVVALEVANPACGDDHGGKGGAVASAHKFQALTDVREALSGVSEQVQLWNLWLCYSRDAEATRISGEMSSLLLAKLDKLDVAIRETRDHIRTQFMSLTHNHSTTWGEAWLDPSSLGGIHKATRSVLGYIVVLSTSNDPPNHEEWFSSGKDIVVRGDENTSSSILIMVMIRYLEEQLARVSRSFPDESLRFLFLLNNFYFVRKQLRMNRILDVPTNALTRKIDGYIDSYLRVSWTPVLKPLHTHYSPCCFTRHSSAYHKFEAKFDKTYTAQKLWKVPDPELREELRTAIIERVISAVTVFLEGGVSTSGSTPKKLEQMLEELFEG